MLLLINPYEENLSTGTRVGIPTRYMCTRGLVPGLYDASERGIKMCRHDPLHSPGTRVPGVPGKLLILIPVTVSRKIRGLILNVHRIQRTFSQNRKAPTPKLIAKSGINFEGLNVERQGSKFQRKEMQSILNLIDAGRIR